MDTLHEKSLRKSFRHRKNSFKALSSPNRLETPSHELSDLGRKESKVCLDIIVPYNDNVIKTLRGSSETLSFSLFQPQEEPPGSGSIPSRLLFYRDSKVPRIEISSEAPEKKITLFALRLAVLEKAASGLGTLGFIWATVVLLGGFADTLKEVDFWFTSVILLVEGTRIFGRSHELELQHEALITASIHKQDKLANLISLQRTCSSSNFPFLPYPGWLFISKNVSRLLCSLQMLSASACVALSLHRLVKQDYGDTANLQSRVLNIFYGLALAEAFLFLVERSYWQWVISVEKLLVEVNQQCGLSSTDLYTIRSFFYETYSRCINGSIFDGLKMDLVSYSFELLQSNGSHGQLSGARILSAFVNNDRFAEDTVRKIGSMQDVVERLIEMLNWRNNHEQEIRRAAAEIIAQLVRKNRNCLRVGGIAGSLESISSLLSNPKKYEAQLTDKSAQKEYDYTAFNLLGLRILKNLAKDHENCGKIGSTRGLLPKVIELTAANDVLLRNTHGKTPEIKKMNRSLQLLKMLASSTGVTGKVLRKEISEIVFTISNLRQILQHRESHPNLQMVAVEILTNLALDEEVRERIGSTGGVLQSLFSLFFMEKINGAGDDDKMKLVYLSGESLTILAFHNTNNCTRMINVECDCCNENHIVQKLIAALNDPVQGIHAAIILRNLCAYGGSDHYDELRSVTAAASQTLKLVMEEQGKAQEAAIGLAAQIFKFLDNSEFERVFEESGITKMSLEKRLVKVLENHPFPSNKAPRIRRFTLEFVVRLMQNQNQNGKICFGFKRMGLEKAVKGVINTTSELESFCTFSGSVGLSRHYVSMQSLVHSAMDGLHRP